MSTDKTTERTKKIKVLIGDDSEEYGKKCASVLREAGFFCIIRPKDGSIILEAIRDEVPDVAVIDLWMPGIDAVELMRKLRKSGARSPVFIVSTPCDSEFAIRQVMTEGAGYCMVKPFDYSVLGDRIKELMGYEVAGAQNRAVSYSVNQSASAGPSDAGAAVDIDIVVTEMIHMLGVPAHIKGYHYLRAAIIYSIRDPNMLESVTKIMYPTVAHDFQTTPSRVERAIRHAIEIAWDRGDVETLNSFFGYTVNTGKGKPTNSEFIALVTDRIKLRYRQFA
ncbi:MAG: sporulation transcription factor Spo0A [Oscillospiraceae bacterium]|nr:sporulation transcription factor Spo0A [Oscillospiraceae bacterium]